MNDAIQLMKLWLKTRDQGPVLSAIIHERMIAHASKHQVPAPLKRYFDAWQNRPHSELQGEFASALEGLIEFTSDL